MVSVEQAKNILAREAQAGKTKAVKVPLGEALLCVLAEAIHARYPSPPFNQSAMDGYAMVSRDVSGRRPIRVNGELAAGHTGVQTLAAGSAIRIFTGARLPRNADLVIPQEFVTETEGGLLVFDYTQFKTGDNVRKSGSQFGKGERLLPKGTRLLPEQLALAAAAGSSRVSVFRKPLIHIVITGNELIRPGDRYTAGKVFETNSLMLKGALQLAGFPEAAVHYCRDEPGLIRRTLLRQCRTANVILFSGGISTGKYDHVKQVLAQLHARELFYKIAQKPGKPLYFGKLAKKYVFGLPGNPAASLTCFYEYVLPFIRQISGQPPEAHAPCSRRLAQTYTKKGGLAHFLKGKITGDRVEILPGQESFKLLSFRYANCLVYIPAGMETIREGEEVRCHLLPQYD
jgi:molybdopterin molybdotransferase